MIVCVLTWSLLGVQKSLSHAHIGLLLGFNSKFPTSIPTPFICGVPPPPGGLGEHSTRARVQSVFLITYVVSGLAEQPKKWEE